MNRSLIVLAALLAGLGCSNTVTEPSVAPPSIPSGVQAEATTSGVGGIIVTWAEVAGAKKYYVYFDEFSGVSKQRHKGKVENTTRFQIFPQQELIHPQSYYYVVTAVNEAVESAESLETKAVW